MAPEGQVTSFPDAGRQGAGASCRSRYLLDWQIGSATGWGTFGLQLALHSVRRGDRLPIPLVEPAFARMNPLHVRLLAEVASSSRLFRAFLERHQDRPLKLELPIVRALGNGVHGSGVAASVKGAGSVGMIFFEDTRLEGPALHRAAQFDRIIAGSTWNADLLRGYGLDHVRLCIQGIDPAIFHPAPRSRWFGDRFVVFSGGKLEFRKGQDIVVAAFREFHRRHPEALLMVAWHNYWPETMAEIGLRGHVQGVPALQENRRLEIGGWLEENGIPRAAIIDLGMVLPAMAGQVVREADVALFPNRAEGGTNLVAMECMASGVPTILSANTGHLDLIEADNCWVLRDQAAVEPTSQYGGTEGWGESSVDEVVEALESVYRDRDEASRRGLAGSRSLHQRTWQRQIDAFFETVADLL